MGPDPNRGFSVKHGTELLLAAVWRDERDLEDVELRDVFAEQEGLLTGPDIQRIAREIFEDRDDDTADQP